MEYKELSIGHVHNPEDLDVDGRIILKQVLQK
jgi:hypothetical protein